MSQSAATEAATAVVACRNEVARLLASAASADGSTASVRLASALHLVQSTCSALDNALLEPRAAARGVPLLESTSRAWRAHGPLPYAAFEASGATSDDPAGEDDLLAAMRACVPTWLSERSAKPHELRERSCAAAGAARRSLELHVQGAFTAVIDFAHVAGGGREVTQQVAATSPGTGMWVPRRVGIGPSGAEQPLGASQPPSLHVFADLTARVGAILAGLDALPPTRRLRPLVVWLCSLHDVFECTCRGCGGVFPPCATNAAQLLPPAARASRLEPFHEGCFWQRYGCAAEDAFVDAAIAECIVVPSGR